MIIVELLPADIFGRRQIYFHFGGSAADHGNDGHSGSDGFVSFEQAFLDIPVERSIEPGVSQLIFMVFVLGGDLLEPVYGFVIGVGGGSVVFVKSHDPFCFRFYLLVFCFSSIQLYLIVGGVQFGQ